MPVPGWVKFLPFAGDALTFANELGAGRDAGLAPVPAAKRAAARAGAGLLASAVQPLDLLTAAPYVTRMIGTAQKARMQQARTPFEKAAVISHPNPLIKSSVLGSPESAARLAGSLDYVNPESWALQIVDFLNPDLSGSYSMDPEQRAEEIKQELLMKAAKKPQ